MEIRYISPLCSTASSKSLKHFSLNLGLFNFYYIHIVAVEWFDKRYGDGEISPIYTTTRFLETMLMPDIFSERFSVSGFYPC